MPGDFPETRTCPLCGNGNAQLICCAEKKEFFECENCHLCFLEPEKWPDRETEYNHYLNHENDPGDARYRAFLSKLANPLLERISASSVGLDYGCGPGPALAAMLREAGHDVHLYDPFFAPDGAVLQYRYDFVTCTETAEHFHFPDREFAQLASLLKPGGVLAIMTSFAPHRDDFPGWYYHRELTHVVFYRKATFGWIAKEHGLNLETCSNDIVFLVNRDVAVSN